MARLLCQGRIDCTRQQDPSVGQMPILPLGLISVPCRRLARGRPTGMLLMASTLSHHQKGLSHNGPQSRHLETPFFPLSPTPHPFISHQSLLALGSYRDPAHPGKLPALPRERLRLLGLGEWGLQECCHRLLGKLPCAVELSSVSTSALHLSGFRLCSLLNSTLTNGAFLILCLHHPSLA